MAQYTFIASRDPFESRESEHTMNLAGDLRRSGHEVTVYLVQNAVFGARKSSASSGLAKLAREGVRILADSFSLKERGIDHVRLEAGIEPAELDVVVDHLAEGGRVIWH
jgi:sulfur relay (sulfurtransferase) complex TusBCD TusD component (DsrE family)